MTIDPLASLPFSDLFISEELLCDAERDLSAIAKFLVADYDRFSSLEFRRVCLPMVHQHASDRDSVFANGSFVAHKHICGLQKAGASTLFIVK